MTESDLFRLKHDTFATDYYILKARRIIWHELDDYLAGYLRFSWSGLRQSSRDMLDWYAAKR